MSKEIKRWIAGIDGWDDSMMVVQATLIETDKQFRIKGSNNADGCHYGSAERMFHRFVDYREKWDKEYYPEVGFATKQQAVESCLAQQLKKASELEAKARAARDLCHECYEQWNSDAYVTVIGDEIIDNRKDI